MNSPAQHLAFFISAAMALPASAKDADEICREIISFADEYATSQEALWALIGTQRVTGAFIEQVETTFEPSAKRQLEKMKHIIELCTS